ncbi:hypothetical protein [Halolamina sp. C58]|uniref:hypothetical protein n=1 Tax=Halolamina sp. C58 TaxID=3421640 RepID=UPI003EBEE2E6
MENRLRLPTGADSREFVLLWAIAAATYGAGDVLTTLVLLYRNPNVVETNALVRAATDAFGPAGLVGLKLGVFLLCLAISVGATGRDDRALYYLPPVALALIGAFTTSMNLRLLIG